jgi:hypothetical protein
MPKKNLLDVLRPLGDKSDAELLRIAVHHADRIRLTQEVWHSDVGLSIHKILRVVRLLDARLKEKAK